MKDAGIDAEAPLSAMAAINRHSARECKVLVASLRSAAQMVTLAHLGHDHFTMAPTVARDLLTCKNSMDAFDAFEQAIATS